VLCIEWEESFSRYDGIPGDNRNRSILNYSAVFKSLTVGQFQFYLTTRKRGRKSLPLRWRHFFTVVLVVSRAKNDESSNGRQINSRTRIQVSGTIELRSLVMDLWREEKSCFSPKNSHFCSQTSVFDLVEKCAWSDSSIILSRFYQNLFVLSNECSHETSSCLNYHLNELMLLGEEANFTKGW
jgi:hypothetical protein